MRTAAALKRPTGWRRRWRRRSGRAASNSSSFRSIIRRTPRFWSTNCATTRRPPALQVTEVAMISVVKAFDRTPLAELPGDDAAALEAKFATAARLFADRAAWLKPFWRIEILRKLAV